MTADWTGPITLGWPGRMTKPREYLFITPSEERLFCVFSDDLEEDPLVFFHGTQERSLDSIFSGGFRCQSPLSSVSFSKRSSSALSHACKNRRGAAVRGAIIAARYDRLPEKGIVLGASDLHVFLPASLPRIFGYIVVPEHYRP